MEFGAQAFIEADVARLVVRAVAPAFVLSEQLEGFAEVSELRHARASACAARSDAQAQANKLAHQRYRVSSIRGTRMIERSLHKMACVQQSEECSKVRSGAVG